MEQFGVSGCWVKGVNLKPQKYVEEWPFGPHLGVGAYSSTNSLRV